MSSYYSSDGTGFAGESPEQETVSSYWDSMDMERTASAITNSPYGSEYGTSYSSAWSADADDRYYNDTCVHSQGYSTQGYSTQGYSTQGYNTQGYSAQGYSAQEYGAQYSTGYSPDTSDVSYSNDNIPRSDYHAISAAGYVQQFDDAVGSIHEIAQHASQVAARNLAGNPKPNSSIVTSKVMRDAGALVKQEPDNRLMDKLQICRRTVQRALIDTLYMILTADGTDISSLRQTTVQVVQEAAYELQHQLRIEGLGDGAEVCHVALGAALTELRSSLAEGAGEGGSEGASPAPSQPLAPTRRGVEGGRFSCKVSGCSQKPFGRQADLERHVKMVHVDDSKKKQFRCDYKRCIRHEQPFFRQDHFRDHLRDFHKEDLPRRGVKNDDAEWWSLRASRPFHEGWWRCNRCLVTRVLIREHGFICPHCTSHCEPIRQRYRAQYEGRQ